MNDIFLYFFKYFIVGQLLLLPIIICYLGIRRVYNNYKFQWGIHRIILVLTLVIPIFLLLKPEVIPERNVSVLQKNADDVIKYEHIELQNNLEFSGVVLIPQDNKGMFVPALKLFDFYSLLKKIPLFVLLVGLFFLFKLLIFEFASLCRLKRNVTTMEYYKGIQVLTTSLVSSPFSYGVIRPLIFLPKDLNESEKKIIIIHEFNHIAGNHLFWLKFEVVLKNIFWINPVYYLLNHQGNELRELICDSESVKEVSLKDYGMALINSAKSNSLNKNLSCTYWGGESLLKKRINKLVGVKKMPKGLNKLTPYVSLFFVLILTIVVPVATFSENNVYTEFLKLSREKGALIAHRELNIIDIVKSIPAAKRGQFPLAFPMKGEYGRITLPWGFNINPFTESDYFHTAVDIGFGFGKHIIASGGGVVVQTGFQKNGYGNYIVIEHTDGFYSLYAQMQNPAVLKGDKVKVGTYLGEMGSSGRSTGPHLHYGVFHTTKKKDFLDLIDRMGNVTMFSLNPHFFLPEEFTRDYSLSDFKVTRFNEQGKYIEFKPNHFEVEVIDGELEITRTYIHD